MTAAGAVRGCSAQYLAQRHSISIGLESRQLGLAFGVTLLVLGAGGCFVCDALGFTMSPLLPTVPGPETSELAERMRGSLAVMDVNSIECRDLIEYPAQGKPGRICLPEDTYCVDSSRVSNLLAYLFVSSIWGNSGAESRWAIRVAPLDARGKTEDVVAGLGSVHGAALAVGAHGRWVAVAWSSTPAEHGARESVALLSIDERRFAWTRPTGRAGPVAVVEDLELVVFTARESGHLSVWTRSFDGVEERQLTSGELVAFDRAERVALIRDGGALFTISVPGGERRIEQARIPGLAGAVLLLLDGQYAVYEGLPTEGAPQARHRMGLAAPPPFSTIKLCDLETGRFVTLVSRALSPGSFAIAP
jgi:hypothetical protein